MHHSRRHRSTFATGHEWADADSVDEETVVNSADFFLGTRAKRTGGAVS